jgi:hypothetical protein
LRPNKVGHIDLVLSDIGNKTGDPCFDSTLNEALLIDLEQSPYLNLLSRSRVRWTLGELQKPKDEKLTAGLARGTQGWETTFAGYRNSVSALGNPPLRFPAPTEAALHREGRLRLGAGGVSNRHEKRRLPLRAAENQRNDLEMSWGGSPVNNEKK